jgi:hypothetical protein
MMNFFKGFAAAAVLVAAVGLPAHAEDAPAATTAPTEAAPSESKPAPSDVARPALVPKAESAPAASTEAPRPHRRYARHHYRHYAYWEPFPVYFPHLYHNRILWNRISWFR